MGNMLDFNSLNLTYHHQGFFVVVSSKRVRNRCVDLLEIVSIIGYYRAIWNLGLKIVLAQEIANDLNVGAAHRDRKVPWAHLWWMGLAPHYNLKAFYVCPNTYSLNDPPYVPIVVRRNHGFVHALLSRFRYSQIYWHEISFNDIKLLFSKNFIIML